MKKFTVLFLPENKQVTVASGTTIMQAAIKAGVELQGPCGGNGTCGKCMVAARVMRDSGGQTVEVLACQTEIGADMTVDIALTEISVQRKSRISLMNVAKNNEIDPGVRKICVEVREPSLDYQAADWQRLLQELIINGGLDGHRGTKPTGDAGQLCLEAIRALPGALQRGKHRVTAVICGNRVTAVEPGDTTRVLYGVAVDLGTTSVAAALLDLNTGKHLAAASAATLQNIYGADVISRITYCVNNHNGLEKLHTKAVQVINGLVHELCESSGVSPGDIHQLTIVGNTTMTHLLAKIDPGRMATLPFVPVFKQRLVLDARDLGLHTAPHAQVHVLPNIAGFLGSDTVGVILAAGLHRNCSGLTLAIDIGTNGEIVRAGRGEMSACSTAAGPAFEGAHIKHGMRAAVGAIEEVAINEDVVVKTIGGRKARGICGSGLIDAVAGMIRAGIIDSTGRMISREDAGHLPVRLRERLGRGDDGKHFILAFASETSIGGPVYLTQKDIRALQLAKGAINAGVKVLMAERGITIDDLDKILLAGAFGNYINKDSALAIGLIPPVSPEKVESVGNAAGVGAQMALLVKNMREEADYIAEKVKHVELSVHKGFQKIFMQSLNFI